ncbi:hypothetical protein BaRGS_00032319 [Batillaria attramentaria]
MEVKRSISGSPDEQPLTPASSAAGTARVVHALTALPRGMAKRPSPTKLSIEKRDVTVRVPATRSRRHYQNRAQAVSSRVDVGHQCLCSTCDHPHTDIIMAHIISVYLQPVET